MRRSARFALLPLLALTLPASAQDSPRSAPQPVLTPDTIPAPRDVPWPGGTMQVAVNATNTDQRILDVTQTIALGSVSGKLVLRLPRWLPGNHAPRGEMDKIAGLIFTVDGKPLEWRRDPVDVFAFHLALPAGAKTLVARFQFLSATKADQGRVVVTDAMMNLQFDRLSLYPAGHFVRQIPVQASVTYPAGWQAATSLRGTRTGDTIVYAPVDYETLVDSPIFAGKYFKAVPLDPQVTLNIVADTPEELAATPAQIEHHKLLVQQADKLFGARHFDHYDFLLAITDKMGSIGLEHHRSSENGVDPGYFLKWEDGPGERNLLPHEYVHSWDGKFRRPARLWQPDYAAPMQNDLMWVYEGQTQFWGHILGARSGLYSKQQSLDAIAQIAARLDQVKGREWRSVEDTTFDSITAARRPKAFASWQRTEDYYNEGLLVWLEADAIIARESKGTKGMDDFARAFFGMKDGDWGVLPYERDEVIARLNAVAPYDWATFLRDRIDRSTKEAPKAGITMGGYSLVYGDKPSSATRSFESDGKAVDQSYGIGLVVKDDGEVSAVIWNSPAFRAGMALGNRIVAVNDVEYSSAAWRKAIAATAAAPATKDAPARAAQPLRLILKQDKRFRTISLDYSGGLRYPRLEKTGSGEGSLDRLLAPR
jgi:predicted metalloprotease with PDZ domain